MLFKMWKLCRWVKCGRCLHTRLAVFLYYSTISTTDHEEWKLCCRCQNVIIITFCWASIVDVFKIVFSFAVSVIPYFFDVVIFVTTISQLNPPFCLVVARSITKNYLPRVAWSQVSNSELSTSCRHVMWNQVYSSFRHLITSKDEYSL